ncbi:Transposable element Tc1 transposase [Araneus ventricosus]|uniref:Transposable element Tc1 transposase n=1 Tax=Araneus ventricosus TaxID=182803 RepID=A0A4Y2MT98_ARAVE|nr:Transposable element Tc1 transposase [Araneus ventricosus]
MSFGVMKANTCCLVRMGYNESSSPRQSFQPQVADSNNEAWGGGNVMVSRCVSRLGMSPLRRIQGIMDKFQYEDILENTMRPYAHNYVGRGFIFKQDNDSKYRSKHNQNRFSRRHAALLDWPSQSPGLNIIEGVWAELESRLVGRNARNADEEFSELEEEWKKIPLSFIQTLLDSMPRRCQAVINAKGFSTKVQIIPVEGMLRPKQGELKEKGMGGQPIILKILDAGIRRAVQCILMSRFRVPSQLGEIY